MNFYDSENEIIDTFQTVRKREVYFPCFSKDAVSAFNAIYKRKKWKSWINNSGKADPPPDFYSNKYGYIMEVMRVDDHAHYNEKGVLVNPVNQRESMLQKEIRQNILKNNPQADLENIKIMINAWPQLPSLEDHNYRFYYENFERVLTKHIKNIPLYRENQPGKKLIFFVFDESTGYLQVDDAELAKRGPVALEPVSARPVFHFFDKRFIDVFQNSDIDFLVWFTPYKMFHGALIQPPKVCIFDMKRVKYKYIVDYPEDMIVSSEA